MPMASFAPFIPRRPPPPLRFLSSQAPARHYCFLGLLQLYRHSSSSSCHYTPELVPSTAGACQEGDAEQGKKAPANAQKGVAAEAAAARRRPAAPKGSPGAPRGGGRGRTTKPKSGGPTPPGKPKEGTGGNGGVIHAVPDAAPSSSPSSSSSTSS